ncbi:hypothetical protein HYO65_gp003 [Tenacibaculum phage PTm1]|uniref:Uncharacterized protein n=2 Tax=Shirahamavirus PTm1 TaxID=2846435 RepID=A0A5S9EQF8_9CAUD|nr:hypothetical protein HYO65_gp003 [Tenacibaculum phage PTm1]BBI90395.1 hypothetical protein [Tenacibaculum phage PTm1]BBI90703.1 hypothetical protein [Tenacibaculum phage PTm5]
MFKNSIEQQLESTGRQHENAVALSNAYLKALTTQEEEVSVDLKNADGTTSNVRVKTNSKIWAELERLRATVLNISGISKDRQNTLVSLDDKTSFREIFVQNFDRAYSKPKASEITLDSGIKIETNGIVESLLSPLTTVEASLAQRFLEANEVVVTKFIITAGDFTKFTDGETYSSVRQKLLNTANGYKYKTVEYLLDTVKRNTRFYGEFNVVSQVSNTDGTVTAVLNTLKYSDKLNSVENSRELVVGNKLVSTDGTSRWNVTAIDIPNNKITIKVEAGYSPLQTGTGTLSILSVDTNETRKVRIPVKLKEKSIMFISPVNKHTNAESPYSEAKLFDSSKYTVSVGNNTFTFDEYFASKVADLGSYFESIVRESAIPASLGEKPLKPTLDVNTFNIVQINRHLTNTPESDKLKKLNSDYKRTDSEISVLNNKISEINARIAKGNYSSSALKAKDEATLSTLIKLRLRSLHIYHHW